MNHYKLGEFVTGENTTFAWTDRWYATNTRNVGSCPGVKTPLNDRRLVIIDEASGLSEDAIGNMSGVRSSGVAGDY